MMAPPNTSILPLRVRLPLYPVQFLSAMALVSMEPLLDPMMRDLGVPLKQ